MFLVLFLWLCSGCAAGSLIQVSRQLCNERVLRVHVGCLSAMTAARRGCRNRACFVARRRAGRPRGLHATGATVSIPRSANEGARESRARVGAAIAVAARRRCARTRNGRTPPTGYARNAGRGASASAERASVREAASISRTRPASGRRFFPDHNLLEPSRRSKAARTHGCGGKQSFSGTGGGSCRFRSPRRRFETAAHRLPGRSSRRLRAMNLP